MFTASAFALASATSAAAQDAAATTSSTTTSTQATQAAPAPADTSKTPASATQPQAPATEIVITGSRIVRQKVTAQPATVLGSDQITKEGYTNLGNALQELPAFSIPGNSPIGSQGSFSAGQTYVNLYNLGSQRTLSLVNGHRFVTSASSSIFGPVAGSPVDFSQIPTDLVDRVEVVGDDPLVGEVVDLNPVYTTLRTEDGGTLQVPNNLFFQKAVKRQAPTTLARPLAA